MEAVDANNNSLAGWGLPASAFTAAAADFTPQVCDTGTGGIHEGRDT